MEVGYIENAERLNGSTNIKVSSLNSSGPLTNIILSISSSCNCSPIDFCGLSLEGSLSGSIGVFFGDSLVKAMVASTGSTWVETDAMDTGDDG